MSNDKSAILFVDRKGEELAPLNEQYSPALLPIAGKCPLEFWFEYLCEQKIKRVFLFVGGHSSAIKERFPSGEHWGLELTYLLSRGEELPRDLISRHANQLPREYLAARADVVPQPRNDGSLANCLSITQTDTTELLEQLYWPSLKNGANNPQLLISLEGYAKVTTEILQSRYWCCTPRGLMLDDHKWTATPEFSTERVDSVDGTLYVGRESVVDRAASLHGSVSIESNCFVDRGATLTNALILPGTYIGQNVSVENALVSGSLLIDLKQGVAQQIGDPALLSPIDMNAAITRTHNTERFAAALLMLLSAWFVLPIAFMFKGKGEAFLSRELRYSNRGSRQHAIELEHLRFNTGWCGLNRWPQLIHVIDGDLKLFGTPVETPDKRPAQDLPLAQGVLTPQDLYPNHPFDAVELQLWGLDLATTQQGFFGTTGRAIKAIIRNCFSRNSKAAVS